MHKALYRVWRPTTFSEVLGQETVVATLKNQIAADRVSHAYIFTGIRGTGKTTLAKLLAKAVNCEHLENGEPCCKCAACIGIQNGSLTDVTEIDAASNTGVDDIRALRDETAFSPAFCKKRVFIIDEVHMLSASAWAALLKIMEEPPEHVMFILATTEIQKVPATILSRCIRFDLARLSAELIEQQLLKVAAAEGFSFEPAAARLIARLADGAMRDAFSLTEACMGDGGTITLSSVEQHTAVADSKSMFRIADCICRHDSAEAVFELYKLYNMGADASRLCTLLTQHFRTLMLSKLRSDALAQEYTSEELSEFSDQSKLFSTDFLINAVIQLSTAFDAISKSPDKRLSLEVAVIKLSAVAEKSAPEANSPPRQPAYKEPSMKPSVTAEPAKENTAEIKSSRPDTTLPPPQKRPAASLPGGTTPFPGWSEFVDKLKSDDRLLYNLLADSSAYVDGTHLLIDANEMFMEYMRNMPELKDKLKGCLSREAGCNLPIGPYKHAVKAEQPDQSSLDNLLSLAESLNITTDISEE